MRGKEHFVPSATIAILLLLLIGSIGVPSFMPKLGPADDESLEVPTPTTSPVVESEVQAQPMPADSKPPEELSTPEPTPQTENLSIETSSPTTPIVLPTVILEEENFPNLWAAAISADEPTGTEDRAKPAQVPKAEKQFIVALDPGHGGPNYPGATHRSGLVEKDLNLTVALKLAELLRAAGYKVVLTRQGDYTLTPFHGENLVRMGMAEQEARADLVNNTAADILVSIHFNGFSDPKVRGTETYFCKDRPFSHRSRMLAEFVQAGLVAKLAAAGYETLDRGVKDDATIGQRFDRKHSFILGQNPDLERPTQMRIGSKLCWSVWVEGS